MLSDVIGHDEYIIIQTYVHISERYPEFAIKG